MGNSILKQIYSRPGGQRIWIIRSEGGSYLKHFVEGGIAAIGFVDDLGCRNNKFGKFNPDFDKVEKK